MKSLSIVFASLALLVTTVAQADLTCVENGGSINSGYAAVLSDAQATILLNGQLVATLAFDRAINSQDSSTPTTRIYQQNVVNGYVVQISSGGFTGQTEAVILQGSAYGYGQKSVFDGLPLS